MLSQFCRVGSKKRQVQSFGRRGAVALEFAILAIPFFTWLLFIFELSYDLFTQEALDAALHVAVRQIQTGNAQNVSANAATNLTAGGNFISSYLCGDAKGLLECDKMWINITLVDPSPPSTTVPITPTTPVVPEQDYTSVTTGAVPMSGSRVDLSNYTSINGGAVSGGGQAATQFCNPQPGQAVLVSVIYLGPSFVGGLLPGLLSAQSPDGKSIVHPTLSTAGFVTEPFLPDKNSNNAPICQAPTLPPS